MHAKYIVPLLAVLLISLVWGCSENSLVLQVRYSEVTGLKQDDAIYFQENLIGKVKNITYTQQGDYLVSLSIAPEFINAVTVDSRFYIDKDPIKPENKTVIIIQEKPGGKVLTKGEIVMGSVRGGFLGEMLGGIKRSATLAQDGLLGAVQEMEKSLNKTSQSLNMQMTGALDELSRQLLAMGREVKKVPEKQEIKQLEQSIKEFAEQFGKAHQNVRDQMQHEVLPQLRKELDRLRRQLHSEGRDQEIEEIDKQVNGMIRA